MKSLRKRAPLAVGLALMLALAPLAAAQTDPNRLEQPDGLGRLLRYAGCAVSIMAAPSGLALVGVTLLCLGMITDEVN
ncbi:MAG: hypothetical protein HZC42_04090 [Candidatus Eisenbacteria bacterium]|nr:hypothetical protein [Candidatus Eisenbacteria bacterium]